MPEFWKRVSDVRMLHSLRAVEGARRVQALDWPAPRTLKHHIERLLQREKLCATE